MVILYNQDYTDKMEVILYNSSKFRKIGSLNVCNNTNHIEVTIQRRLFSVYKSSLIFKNVYYRIRPVGSQRPRLYDLHKIRRDNMHLRPKLLSESLENKFAK